MIYQDITAYYITSNKNDRLVRYELIKKQSNDYFVKVFDQQSGGIAAPKVIIEIDAFDISYQDYTDKHLQSGFQTSVKSESAISYEAYIQKVLQEHRNKLD
ncbi:MULTISPECIES: hypothetical protein [unclassified Serratia (in: enterobacteria)]|uniref:hypothetical protein n=1 Tax=unclassified Serratia (in: enterobacteria) TaxID=2647522 RepID=UPI0021182C88|nr:MULTISPECIES: hypothetical protein [unclassified Serratia (in: enterobacteria)]